MADVLKLFLEISITASIMIGIVLLIQKVWSKKMNPAVMLLLWGMVLVRLCIPFTVESPVRIADLLPQQAVSSDVQVKPAAPASNNQVDTQMLAAENQELTKANTQIVNQETPQGALETGFSETLGNFIRNIPLWSLLATIWMAGMTITLFLFIRKANRFRKKLSFCNPVTDTEVLETIGRYKQELGVKKHIMVLTCDFVRAPAVFGYFKPRILIPTQFIKRMDRSSLDAILLHEIYHIRSHDILMNYIWLAAKALHWFNPLVWIAYRRFEDDVEICRDQKVAARLNAEGMLVYSQSLVEAARFSKKSMGYVPSLAKSFIDKSKLQERISRLMKPAKKSKSTVMVCALLGILMLVTCFTTACQPTPDKPAVVNKNDGQLEQKIQATPSAPGSATAASGSITGNTAAMQTTKKITEKFDTGTGIVDMDADFVIPASSNLPVVTVGKATIQQDDVDKLIKYFLKDAKLMNPKDIKETVEDVDAAYISRIAQFQAEINQLEDYDTASAEEKAEMDKDLQTRRITREHLLESLKAALTEAQQSYEVDRKNAAAQNSPASPQPFNTKIDSGDVQVAAELTPGFFSTLSISNGPSGAMVTYKKDSSLGYLEVSINGKVVKDDTTQLSGEAALTVVRNMFQALGLGITDFNQYVLDQSYPVSYSHGNVNDTLRVLTFNDTLNGIPISNVNNMQTMSALSIEDKAKEVYAPKANPPQITAVVNEVGEVVALSINNPISILQMENPNVQTIGIDDAVSIFKDKMKGTDLVNSYEDNARVIINEIRLSLLTTSKKDDINNVRVMPVYDFIGYDYMGDKAGVNYPHATDGKSALTINAIDGSIIDRTLGY